MPSDYDRRFLPRFRRKEELYLEHHIPQLFHSSQCRMPIWLYLAFRFLMVAITLHSFVLSVIYMSNAKFLIFFTIWTYFLQTFTMIYDLIIVAYYSGLWNCQSTIDYDLRDPIYGRMPIHLKIKWILHGITTTIPIIVTLVYWSMLYPAERRSGAYVDGIIVYLNIELHLLNSIVALVNFFVSGTPFRLYHFVYAIIYGAIYVIFAFIYHLCGGTGIKNKNYIYFFLNFDGQVWIIFATMLAVLVTNMALHFLFTYLKHLQTHRIGPCCTFCSYVNYPHNPAATIQVNDSSGGPRVVSSEPKIQSNIGTGKVTALRGLDVDRAQLHVANEPRTGHINKAGPEYVDEGSSSMYS